MSNNPSSRVFIRLQPSALIFFVLLLVLGALLLLSNGIDPNSTKRAQFSPTPVDPFTVVKYVSWKSADGMIQAEIPDTWQAQASSTSPFSYAFAPANIGGAVVTLQLRPTARYQGASATTSPADLLNSAFTDRAKDLPPVQKRDVKLGALSGVAAHFTDKGTDTSSNQPTVLESELWVVALDPSHVLVLSSGAETGNWEKLQPIFDHIVSSLKFDTAATIKALDAQFPATPATPAATTPATAPAKQ